MTLDNQDHLADEPPPVTEYIGPADPEDRILAEPDRAPYTVIVFSIDAVYMSGSAKNGTAVVHVTAINPDEAGASAVRIINEQVRNSLWTHAIPLFVTEGYHLDVRPELLNLQSANG